MSLKLFELVGTDEGRPFSPFCWRTRMALAHKGLSAQTIQRYFTEKDAIAPHKSEKVPVLIDGESSVADSWAIANHLEDRYPVQPSAVRRRGRAAPSRRTINWWGDIAVVGSMFSLIVADIPAHLKPVGDAAYFTSSREAKLRQTAGGSGWPDATKPSKVSRRVARPDAADPEDAALSRRGGAGLSPKLRPGVPAGAFPVGARSQSSVQAARRGRSGSCVARKRQLDAFDGMARKSLQAIQCSSRTQPCPQAFPVTRSHTRWRPGGRPRAAGCAWRFPDPATCSTSCSPFSRHCGRRKCHGDASVSAERRRPGCNHTLESRAAQVTPTKTVTKLIDT